LLACGAAACSSPATEITASEEQPVLGGTDSGPDEDMVVEVISKSDTVSHTCTGTLLAPNVVITARHCVANFSDATFSCTSDGELVAGSKGGMMGPLLDPGRISIRVGTHVRGTTAVAVGRKIFATQATSICRNDIAIVVLATELTDLPIAPVRTGRGNFIGEQLRVVGYGVDDASTIDNRHTRSGLKIAQIGSSQFNANPDPVPSRTFVTEGPSLCIGDSGGPAFADSGAVTGVWSQVVGDCKAPTARNYFTEVAPFEDELIVPAFAEAGALVWREGTTGPGEGTGGMSSAGAPGEGGSGDVGGEVGSGGTGGGEVGSGGTSGGDVGSGGLTASGGRSASGGIAATGGDEAMAGAGGLRKKGGCTCNVPGSATQSANWFAAPLLGLGVLLRRRAKRSRSV
jgi:hypothetical protein